MYNDVLCVVVISVLLCFVCRTREELATKVTELEASLAEAKRTITALQSDNSRLLEHSTHIQVGGGWRGDRVFWGDEE